MSATMLFTMLSTCWCAQALLYPPALRAEETMGLLRALRRLPACSTKKVAS